MNVKTSIIPEKQKFYCNDGVVGLNLKAISFFTAAGFFLEKDTYYNNKEAMQPSTDYVIDDKNEIKSSKKYWEWHYSPRDISLKQATEEFADVFEKVSVSKLKNKKVILPLSGGLDSRTQAAVLDDNNGVQSYSYKFENSFNETKYGKEISKQKSFGFTEYVIPKGYLWKVIENLAEINQCYADFTNPRQMAVINEISKLGEIFYLGHWGDVLFDDMDVDDEISFDEQVNVLKKKIIKRGGYEIASSLWESWGLDGTFDNYLNERISKLLSEIKIDNANARIRAFKSIYWAPRWTSANMVVFSNFAPLVLPYYDDEMCKFICTVPEEFLAGRQIQINYIKMKDPKLAQIPWQNYDPLNLYNYKKYQNKSMVPLRAMKKAKRILNEKISGKKLVTRNWELQFLGEDNDINLRNYLFDNKKFSGFVAPEVVKKFYDKFKNEDPVYHSHPLTMLLTLSLFSKKNL